MSGGKIIVLAMHKILDIGVRTYENITDDN